ncbi:hypothetical protein [Streptomyces xanthochromogenes]|uniref:hypothetical protein n=1 Tax=Streptomyces xanthochromogenes TaxID=67384 RepID=UPI002F4172BE
MDAIINVRQAAGARGFSVDGVDWEALAVAYRGAVGATPWWRHVLGGVTVLAGIVGGQASAMWMLQQAVNPRAGLSDDEQSVIALGIFANVMLFVLGVVGPISRWIARPDPGLHQLPVPPALSLAESCGELLTAAGSERAALHDRIDSQLDVLIARLWKYAGKGGGVTHQPLLRAALTVQVRRVDTALRQAQLGTWADPTEAVTLGRLALTIADRLATGRFTSLLDDADLPADPGSDKKEGRRLVLITAMGLLASTGLVFVLMQLHALPESLILWVFAVAFVSVFVGVFGLRSSARPLAVLRQRIAALGTGTEPIIPSEPPAAPVSDPAHTE